MVWLRIDDQIAHHPKFIEAGPLASWLWVCGNGYCNKYLTDGFIPKSAIKTLGTVPNADKWAERLVAAGLWETAAGGYRVHDFHDHNPSAAEVKSDREWDRRRKELYATPGLVPSIKARDGNRCRYCGVEVNWTDRRGINGGQFDHVVPRGPNSLENIVVTCRRCNIKKGGRTPKQAGLKLLPVPNQIGTSSSLAPARPNPGQKEEQIKSTGAPRRPVEISEGTHGLYCVIAEEALQKSIAEDNTDSLANVAEIFKTLCGQRKVSYDGDVQTKAINAVLVAHGKRRAS